MNFKAFGVALLIIPATASAQSMKAERFHQRATALQQKGMMALFSGGEIKVLTAEAQAAGKLAGETRRAAIKNGQSPRYCPPAGQVSIGDKEFMARLSAIPASERAKIDMTEATTRILAAKFPCR